MPQVSGDKETKWGIMKKIVEGSEKWITVISFDKKNYEYISLS
jgi:hypothetical protein